MGGYPGCCICHLPPVPVPRFATVFKYSSDGVLFWYFDTGEQGNDVCVDDDDNIYVVDRYYFSDEGVLWKLDTDGNAVWKFLIDLWTIVSKEGRSVTTDGSDVFLLVESRRYRMTSDGDIVWQEDNAASFGSSPRVLRYRDDALMLLQSGTTVSRIQSLDPSTGGILLQRGRAGALWTGIEVAPGGEYFYLSGPSIVAGPIPFSTLSGLARIKISELRNSRSYVWIHEGLPSRYGLSIGPSDEIGWAGRRRSGYYGTFTHGVLNSGGVIEWHDYHPTASAFHDTLDTAIDFEGNVAVVGGPHVDLDHALIKHDPLGTILWVQHPLFDERLESPGWGFDPAYSWLRGVSVDSEGSIICVGDRLRVAEPYW